ncbi:MAG: hydrogenase 3 maturation endopeptidase HyCI [Candidatus Bathyarchaeum tardum]|nr:MAG: hydrogenase 3 maturation endopeptidase HyCI [Candidatus Bathyarchaeum tardum]
MSGAEEQTVEKPLKEFLTGSNKVVVAGVGNPFRKDDFVGVEIVRKLKTKVSDHVFLIEAETIPESYMQKIVAFKPTHVLLVDAGIINKQPGNAMLARPEQLIRKSSISTHTLPLRIFCDYITKTANAKIALLIIQPMNVDFGEGLTPELKETAETLATLLQSLLP